MKAADEQKRGCADEDALIVHGLRPSFSLGHCPYHTISRPEQERRTGTHPSATSSAIITLNPNAKHSVPTLECCPWDISGIKTP